MNEDKLKQAVNKLIDLTKSQKLIWKLTSSSKTIYKIYKSTYLHQLIGKFDIVFYVSNLKFYLKIQDGDLELFKFPDLDGEFSQLYQEIIKQVFSVDKLLDSILEN